MGYSDISPWAFIKAISPGQYGSLAPGLYSCIKSSIWHPRKEIMDLQYDISAGRETFSTCQERDNILQTNLQYNQAGQQQNGCRQYGVERFLLEKLPTYVVQLTGIEKLENY